ncbi:uncharacterized protein LOC107883830 isoform X1 [Acyrthosiphon pisum]|uniref:Uncharacterized protein n=1 Tax=Acyrthosiphon pisum TaxID=7029 RepID=A0A8R2D3W3_ACYPI|nr:uncharacterized protein LOC107883830 isoform X1 [Acyrthosiphon pisum]|eukprot:XP_016660140.1 PREDICTED: uncharacterized protein LOC107883830 isoform X1 [Acyrthosiphon pisum]
MLNVEKQKLNHPNNKTLQSNISNLTTPHITETGTNKIVEFNHSLKLSIPEKSSNILSASLLDDKLCTNYFNDDIGDINCNIHDDDAFDDNASTIIESFNIEDELRSWVLKFKVSHNSANCILRIIKSAGINVPKDIRTLMKTPTTHVISNIDQGSYIHLGLENMILPILKKYDSLIYSLNKVLKIGINLDGLPLSRSSKSQLWPILIEFTNCNLLSEYVLPIGIFHGNSKPKSIHEFLNPFLSDLLTLLNCGLNVNGNIYQFEVGHVVCDSPAKSFLLNVKSFNAYFGCTSCTQEGSYINNRMAFLEIESPLRTDESFRSKTQEEYHKGNSPLELLPIDMIKDVCLDYMHNVCLGVTKRLIEFWVKGKKDVRLIEKNKVRISNNLLNLRSYVPSEFSRLPRGLDDIEYFKATELRMFVIHSGLIVLKGNLSKQMYSHFKLFVCALRILITPDICQTLNNLAQSLLNEFVTQYSSLYGAHFVTYNVHSLLHLPMYVKVHGCLDNFSCFKYENYLQYIKKSIKSAKYPLQEVTNRIMEKQNYFIANNITLDPIVIVKEIKNTTSSPYFCLADRLFEKIFIKDLRVTININNKRDKYIMLKNNDIVIVNNIVQPQNKLGFKLIVQKCMDSSSLFTEPIISSIIGLHTVNPIVLSDNFTVNISDIKYKCFFIYLSNDKAIISTLNHSFIDNSY